LPEFCLLKNSFSEALTPQPDYSWEILFSCDWKLSLDFFLWVRDKHDQALKLLFLSGILQYLFEWVIGNLRSEVASAEVLKVKQKLAMKFFNLLKYALGKFSFKYTFFWLGIICNFLAAQGQRLPGVAGVWTPNP